MPGGTLYGPLPGGPFGAWVAREVAYLRSRLDEDNVALAAEAAARIAADEAEALARIAGDPIVSLTAPVAPHVGTVWIDPSP